MKNRVQIRLTLPRLRRRRGRLRIRAAGASILPLCLVQFVDVLGVTIVVTALPSMLSSLRASASSAALVVTGYAMCFGGLLLLGARLGDRYGQRRVLLSGLVGFGFAAVLAASAMSIAALAAARCLQGAAAAVCVPNALRLLIAATPEEGARRRALSAWSATGAAAGASGFVLGGALTQLAGWRAVFWLNVPLAAALALAILTTTPRVARHRRGRLDVAGGVALTSSVMALIWGASRLEQPDQRTFGLLALAISMALLAGFVRIERRSRQPLLSAAAIRHGRLRLGAAAAALNTATTSSIMTLATLYLQDTRGVSPGAAGLSLLPFSLAVVAGSTLAAPVLRRRSAHAAIALGLVTIAAGAALLLAAPTAVWLLPVAVAIAGAGIGLSSVAATSLGTDVPPGLQGTATGVLNTAAQLGSALGVCALVLIATSTRGSPLPLTGTPLAWACAATGALGAAIAISVINRRQDSSPRLRRQPGCDQRPSGASAA